MKLLLIVTCHLAILNSVSLEEPGFQQWKEKFGKIYKTEAEENQHMKTWLENLKFVKEHNMQADQGIKSYRLGMTFFADMDDQEYNKLLKGCLLPFNNMDHHDAAIFLQQTGGAPLPETVDWRDKGYVTEVKDQGKCGSCWAFSATGGLEGQTFKKTGKLVSLSEQQLVDCSGAFGNSGCKGGWMHNAFEYVKANGGLETEDSYPYEGRDASCKFNPDNVVATCDGYRKINSSDENALQEAVANVGPISVGIFAEANTFRLYKSGIYDDPSCRSNEHNHGVLVVGYGTENGKDYWLVKNSWGKGWGDNGYIKMSRNKDNQCGIATAAFYPLVNNKTKVQCESCSAIFVLGYLLLGMFY